MDTSPELVNPTGKFKIGSVEAELALNYAGAARGQPDITQHLPANYRDLSETNKYNCCYQRHNWRLKIF